MDTNEKMSIAEKLLEMQTRVDSIVKDGQNTSDKYDFASDENVLNRFRPMMDELHLLLVPNITKAEVREGVTKSGTTRYMTELWFNMQWVDVDSGERVTIPWYAQGVDLAGEKGVGKAATYAEKYFLLKLFHVSTRRDDPDEDQRTRTGDLRQRGTAAAHENGEFCRTAITAMLTELYAGDAAKISAALVAMTKSDKRGFAGVDAVGKLSDSAATVAYAKIKKQYETRVGHEFSMEAK